MDNKTIVDYAVDRFESGFNCAEAVLSALIKGQRLDGSIVPAAVLGGGVAGQGWVCGALSGALLAFAYSANVDPEDKASKTRLRKESAAFCKWFEKHAGSQLCRDILGFAPGKGTNEQKAKSRRETCAKLVADTVSRAMSLNKHVGG